MRTIFLTTLALCAFGIPSSLAAETHWKTELAKDGKTTVKSHVSQRKDESGNDVLLIQYVVSKTANVDYSRTVAAFKDMAKHRVIADVKSARIVKTLSNSRWIVYYESNAPWPFPSSDCVVDMSVREDAATKTTTFELVAAPNEVAKKEVDRMTYYFVTYSIRDLGDGKCELSSTAKMSPTVRVPQWMVEMAFPEDIAEILRRIETQAKL